jgi:alkylated DNA repair dioxygenase AlkB
MLERDKRSQMVPSPLPEIRYLPGFVAHPESLYLQVQRETVWDERMAARRTASFGVAYNYSGISYPDVPMPEAIGRLASDIAGAVAHPINNCLANLYRDGGSTMGFHSDSTAELAPESKVAVLSLGHARTLTFRRKEDRLRRLEYLLAPGSLLIMMPSVQAEWQHALLKATDAGPRISLTFRHILCPTAS